MRLPQEPICQGHFCISGDVSIAPSATIAPGVLLQADPGCRLAIGEGVCIGVGSVVQACQGMLEIASGATLGEQVLIVGKGCIGANSCIGAKATVWNVDIAPNQVVASNALMGDMGRQVDFGEAEAIAPPASQPKPEAAIAPVITDPIMENPPLGASAIYGKAALDRLMGALFPYRESLNGLPPSSDDAD